jgi:hypothetical protein
VKNLEIPANSGALDYAEQRLHAAKETRVQIERAAILGRALHALRAGDLVTARDILHAEYPFVAIPTIARRYTEVQSPQVFRRDGFVDRYSGQRLVFPGVLRLLSRLLPLEFPYHSNWKMAETHAAYWELFPTIDHVHPVARGGSDSAANWVTTSMLRNASKASWTLDELGWSICAPGSLADWDGLTALFVDFVASERSFLDDPYLRKWYNAAR